MTWLILLGYIALATYIARSMPPTDFERDYLGLDTELMAADYQHDFGLPLPRRKPWRLPLEYCLYGWTGTLWHGRVAAIGVSSLGLWLTMQYAQALGGPRAGIIAGLVVLSSSYLVSQFTAASYKAPVATLWVGGLYALATGNPVIALGCGIVLALLRPTSWWMTLWLLWASGGIALVGVLGVILGVTLWVYWPRVVRSQGWWFLLSGQPCPVRGIPRDGWLFGLKTLGQRYEAWGVWVTVVGVLGHWNAPGAWLLGLTLALFVLTHLPRMLIRPKWAVGYVAEWLFPVAIAIGLALA